MKACNARNMMMLLWTVMTGIYYLPSYADQANPYQKTVGGIAIYLGVVPAKVVGSIPSSMRKAKCTEAFPPAAAATM